MTPGDERLVAALQAEHAAIFGYGAVGAHLDQATIELARSAELAHRTRRDTLLIRLASKGITAPPAQPAYVLPYAVDDQETALGLAVTVEERCAAIWRLALPDNAGDERRLALDALVDCATRATRLRRAAGTTPPTTQFPGR